MSFADRYHFDDKEHIHTLDGKPLTGTSSVMSIVAKPLTWWAAGEAVKTLGWTHPKFTSTPIRETAAAKVKTVIETQTLTDYLKLLDTAYAAHSKALTKSAKKGKDLHAVLEEYVKDCIKNHGGKPYEEENHEVFAFQEWSVKNVDKFLWSEMHTYSETNWLGGISDCGALMKDGKVAIIDFKSSKEAYPNQMWQVGGYDLQIRENGGYTTKGEVMVGPMEIDQHIIIPFGASEFTATIDNDVIANRNSFLAALHLYRENKRLSND